MTDPGVDELASVVAWWLAHPWRAVGVYLVAVAISAILKGVLAAAVTDAKKRKDS